MASCAGSILPPGRRGGIDASSCCAKLGLFLSAAGPLGGSNGFDDWETGVAGTECEIDPLGPVGGMPEFAGPGDADAGPVVGVKLRL